MCGELKKLLFLMKPVINNIDVVKKDLDSKSAIYNHFCEFMAFVGDDVYKVGQYKDQDFVIEYLSRINSDPDEYNGAKYLLSCSDTSVQYLPQYDVAKEYFNKIILYYNVIKEASSFRVYELKNIYDQKSLTKKYYDLLSSDNYLIDDIDEFISVVGEFNFTRTEIRNIYASVIKSNVKYYRSSVKNNAFSVSQEHEVKQIHEVIYNNKYLLERDNQVILDKVMAKVDINLSLKELVNNGALDKVSITDLVNAKKVWLMKKITRYYKSCEFGRLSKYFDNYQQVVSIEEKIKNVDDVLEIKRILEGEK